MESLLMIASGYADSESPCHGQSTETHWYSIIGADVQLMPLPGSLRYELPLMELLCSVISASFDFPLTHRSFWPLPELLPSRSGIAVASFCWFSLFVLLRKCVGLCFEVAFDFGLRRKGLGEAFRL
ncbi:uncharacterized protein DS421_18g623560 [Arachis hypogaea]|nr:uncharacterized protein DS421_18g623560 [Arachis hypogaea]